MFRKTTGAIRKNTGPNIENDPVVSTWFIKTTQKKSDASHRETSGSVATRDRE